MTLVRAMSSKQVIKNYLAGEYKSVQVLNGVVYGTALSTNETVMVAYEGNLLQEIIEEYGWSVFNNDFISLNGI